MADDRNTGLPYKTSNPYADQSFNQQQNQTAGPRTDTGSTNSTERTNQAISSAQSALNTTPAALAALDQLLVQLTGKAASTIDQDIPMLEWVEVKMPNTGGIPVVGGMRSHWRDPKTGKIYDIADGNTENGKRLQQRKKWQPTPAVEAGTPEQRQQVAQRQEEIARNRATQGTYSKTEAFADAQGLVNKAIADSLERTLPQITSALEGSGTSKGSMAALLTQRAAEKAGVEGAALGAQTAVAYGGINTALASTLEMLTRSDPNSPTAMLIQALGMSKGLISDQIGSQNTMATGNKQADTQQDIGQQNTFVNTLKEILQPLGQVNNMGDFNPTPRSQGPSVQTNQPSIIARNPSSNFDNRSIQVSAGSDDAIYGGDNLYAEDEY